MSLISLSFNFAGCCQRKTKSGFAFSFGLPTNKRKIQGMPVKIKITNEQKVSVTLTPTTDSGKPAKLDGKPTWEVIIGDSAIEVSEEGLTAVLTSSDNPGDTQILIKADADIGEGVEEISDVITLEVVGASAKNLGITVGKPEPKTPPAP